MVDRRVQAVCRTKPAEVQDTFDLFRFWAGTNATLGSTRGYVLLTLTQFDDLFRGLTSNDHDLCFGMSLLWLKAVSALKTTTIMSCPPRKALAVLPYPLGLRPSAPQPSTFNHRIDFLPSPALWDNILPTLSKIYCLCCVDHTPLSKSVRISGSPFLKVSQICVTARMTMSRLIPPSEGHVWEGFKGPGIWHLAAY